MSLLPDGGARAPADIEVELVHWNATEGVDVEPTATPRLWLVACDAAPPRLHSVLDDWIRAPADPIDLQARVANLRRAAHRRALVPELDEDGVVRRGRAWVAVRPAEALLLRLLLARHGRIVAYDELETAAWPQGAPSSDALHDRVGRLAPRLAPLGVRVHRVRGKGYLLELAPPVTA
jgi:DNA-binding response OmpR family regulator